MSSSLIQLTPEEIQQLLTENYNANASLPANTGPGSALGAIFNALMSLAIAIQQQIAYTNAIERLSTIPRNPDGTPNPDVDSFCMQFNVPRIAATYASDIAIFSTNSPAVVNLPILAGTYVSTPSGTLYRVQSDLSIPISGTQTSGIITAVDPGPGGNASPGQITQIISLPGYPAPDGITSVTNPNRFSNGFPAETDDDYIARFAQVMSSRWATDDAVAAAVAAAQGGITYTIGDMLDPAGNVRENFFSVIVNELGQSLGPSDDLLTLVNGIVKANRPLGMPYALQGPELVTVDVAGVCTINAGFSADPVLAAASTAVTDYLNGIGLDPGGAITTAQASEITVLVRTTPGVSNFTGLTLNGQTSDVTAGFGQQIVAGNIALTSA